MKFVNTEIRFYRKYYRVAMFLKKTSKYDEKVIRVNSCDAYSMDVKFLKRTVWFLLSLAVFCVVILMLQMTLEMDLR